VLNALDLGAEMLRFMPRRLLIRIAFMGGGGVASRLCLLSKDIRRMLQYDLLWEEMIERDVTPIEKRAGVNWEDAATRDKIMMGTWKRSKDREESGKKDGKKAESAAGGGGSSANPGSAGSAGGASSSGSASGPASMPKLAFKPPPAKPMARQSNASREYGLRFEYAIEATGMKAAAENVFSNVIQNTLVLGTGSGQSKPKTTKKPNP